MSRTKARRIEPGPGLLRCCYCKRDLPREKFLTITVRDKRCKPGHSWTGPSYDCRECRNELKRERRRKNAEAAGKAFEARGDREAWEAATAQRREAKKAEREARYQRWAADQKASSEDLRKCRAESRNLSCSMCGDLKPRDQFYPSQLTACKQCQDERARAERKRAVESLADSYVRRQLANDTGLRRSEIPALMVEAQRLKMLIGRATPTNPSLFADWIKKTLAPGPMDAQRLNQLAMLAGFRPLQDKQQRKARARVATYDQTTKTWRTA